MRNLSNAKNCSSSEENNVGKGEMVKSDRKLLKQETEKGYFF